MNNDDYLTVAAFQGSIKEGDYQANLKKVLEITELAQKRDIDILCFPETYLHGYFSSEELARKNAIDLRSPDFFEFCSKFLTVNSTILLGLNEIEENKIYNTVVVIEKGECLGKYRKAYSYKPYDYYTLGRNFPVFEKKGIKYGIIICLDSFYREPAYITALNGARILFCPSFNRVSKYPDMSKFIQKMYRREHFISRAFDNHCWFISSDIIWDENEKVCPGFSCIINDSGELIAKAEAYQEALISYSIPLSALQAHKKMRLLGNPDLFEIVKTSYFKAIDRWARN